MTRCPICDAFTESRHSPVECIGVLKARIKVLEVSARLDAAAKSPRWIPVTERLPEDGQWCWVWNAAWAQSSLSPVMASYVSGDGFRDPQDREAFSCWEATHWLPIDAPAPPA